MREKDNPKVRAFLEAENAYTDAFMKPTEAFRRRSRRDARTDQGDRPVRAVPGRRLVLLLADREGKQYPIYCRKKGSLEAPEEVYLDVNALADGEKFMAVAARNVTDNGNCSPTRPTTRASATTRSTSRTSRPEASRRPSRAPPRWPGRPTTRRSSTRSPTWPNAPTGSTATRSARPVEGRSPLEEKDEMFRVFPGRSRSRAIIFVGLARHVEQWYSIPPASRRRTAPDSAHEKDHEYDVDHHGDLFYIDPTGCRNYRVVTAPMADPGQANSKEMTPCREDVMIEDVGLFDGYGVSPSARTGCRACASSISRPAPRSASSSRRRSSSPTSRTTTVRGQELRYGYQS